MDKKYNLKSNQYDATSGDGTENAEHIFDMIDRANMCLSNIQDNNDLCINMFKLKKDKIADEDELDALQLLCQEGITIEEQSIELKDKLATFEEKINQKTKVKESEVEEVLKQILILELHSKSIVEKIFH